MRTLLAAPLLASLTIATLQNPADACSPYERAPKAFQLTSHWVPKHGYRSADNRTFALLGDRPKGELAWQAIAPGTYDYTRIADAPDLETPMELTLVGRSGVQVVSSRARTFIDSSWAHRGPMGALELDVKKGDFSIALAGRHTDAKWIALDVEKAGTAADLEWVKPHSTIASAGGGLPSDLSYIYVARLGALETVSVLTRDNTLMTLIRSGSHQVGGFTGRVLGAVTIKNQQYAVRSAPDGSVSLERLYARV